MSEWASAIKGRLAENEKLLSVVDHLLWSVVFVPHASPAVNYAPGHEAILALTNCRLIAVLWDGTVYKWVSVSALNSLTERLLNKQKATWPYQAMLMLPGGMGLIVQTQTTKPEHARQLAQLLLQAFMQFSIRQDDDSSLAAILTHEEEEEERRRQAAYDDDRK